MRKTIRLISISTMFPNAKMPVHAQFVKQRLDALAHLVTLRVVSPVPYFPGETLLPKYRNRHAVPYADTRNAYPTHFPKFFSFPGVLKFMDGLFVGLSVIWFVRREGIAGEFDAIDCHLGYPDGMAGYLLSRWSRKPYFVTLRGHDINDLHLYPLRIHQVVFALKHSQAYFGVAQALVDGAVRLGAPAAKGFPSMNGIDPARFHPTLRQDARARLGLDSEDMYFLSVSHLVKRKGVDILIRALALLERVDGRLPKLIIVGKGGEEGDLEAELRHLAKTLKVENRIVWAGAVGNENLRGYYCAANLLCLASEKEGLPNVVLEALACGTPVAAMATWGVPEIVSSPDLGILVQERTPQAFAQAMDQSLTRRWDSAGIAAHAGLKTWENTAKEVYRRIAETLGENEPHS